MVGAKGNRWIWGNEERQSMVERRIQSWETGRVTPHQGQCLWGKGSHPKEEGNASL